MIKKSLNASMNPKGKSLVSASKYPIVIMLDVTGSNINFARLVYDKMPMFYGEIEQKGYLSDFDIAICAVGDAYTDSYPLQVADFAKGIELDAWIEKLVLESGGGGQEKESYELAAYYLLKRFEFASDATPIIFFIADEAPYPKVDKKQAREFDLPLNEPIDPFPGLNDKVRENVFCFLNKYGGRRWKEDITEAWRSRLAPEHVIRINEEKAIVDLMLGVLAMIGKTSLKTYALDMAGRDQTKARITGVTEALEGVSTALAPIERKSTDLKVSGATPTSKKGKRL
jgi:hypothetical protein